MYLYALMGILFAIGIYGGSALNRSKPHTGFLLSIIPLVKRSGITTYHKQEQLYADDLSMLR